MKTKHQMAIEYLAFVKNLEPEYVATQVKEKDDLPLYREYQKIMRLPKSCIDFF